MAEKSERTETPESAAQGSTVSLVLDRNQPDYIPNFDPVDLPEKGDDDENLVNARTGMAATYLTWTDHLRLISINPHLSDLGKADAAQKALPAFEEKLKPVEQIVESHDERVKKDKRGLLPDLGPAKDAASEVRAEGLRRWFSEQPKDKHVGIMRRALEDNNRELLSALISANDAMDLIHPKVKESLITTLIERDHPDVVAKLAVRERRVAVAKAALQRVRELMRGTAPTTLRARLQGAK